MGSEMKNPRPKKFKYRLQDDREVLNELELYPQEAGKANAGFLQRGLVRRWYRVDDAPASDARRAEGGVARGKPKPVRRVKEQPCP